MKKRVLTYLALALLLSCTRIEVQDWEPQSLVAYNVVSSTAAQTKATTAFPTTSTFMSSAYQLESGQSWDSNYALSTLKFGPEEVKYMGTYWSTDDKHFWEDSKTLTFFSYAPASLSSLGLTIPKEGVSVDGWDVTDDSKKDKLILVADIAKDKVKNESFAGFTGVPTHFRHKLSKVSIRLAKSTFSEADEKIYVTKLSIGSYYAEADFKKGGTDAESWTNLRNKVTETVLYKAATGKLLSDEFWVLDNVMIPQTLTADSYLTISYKSVKSGVTNDEGPVTLYFMRDFRSGIWAIGTHVTYTLKVGAGMFPIQFEASADAWIPSPGGTTGIEIL
ncbi:MAG: fimbrillin family protein [Candidatus Cryptobacteroides sp.]|nr:fimbrillin family protein [Candidatus Cryptobacteroides sp.]